MFIWFKKKFAKNISDPEFKKMIDSSYRSLCIKPLIKKVECFLANGEIDVTNSKKIYYTDYLIELEGDKYFHYVRFEFESVDRKFPADEIDYEIYFSDRNKKECVNLNRLLLIVNKRRSQYPNPSQ